MGPSCDDAPWGLSRRGGAAVVCLMFWLGLGLADDRWKSGIREDGRFSVENLLSLHSGHKKQKHCMADCKCMRTEAQI